MQNQKLIVELPEDLVHRMRIELQNGTYRTVSEFLRVAIENQIALGQMVLQTKGPAALKTIEEAVGFEVSKTPDESKKLAPEVPTVDASSVLRSLRTIDYGKVKVVPPPDYSLIPDVQLWGQYNRIFPLKITLRCVARMIAEGSEEWADLTRTRNEASEAALMLGEFLENWDERLGNKRGFRLSTGLPSPHKDRLSSMSRYRNQFVGYLKQNGAMEGMASAIRWVAIRERSDGRIEIGLTKKGLEFCRLQNPIIDLEEHDGTLSKEESHFYVGHVLEELPREREFMFRILRSVKNGADTSLSLGEEIRKEGMSDAVLSTITYGGLGRLSELGMLNKSMEGLSVHYSLSEFGREVLSNDKTQA